MVVLFRVFSTLPFTLLSLSGFLKGDGSKRNKGVALITHGFTLKEVILLMNILIIKFDIQPTIYSYETPRDPAIYRGPKPEPG
jgi:hypothetical protein